MLRLLLFGCMLSLALLGPHGAFADDGPIPKADLASKDWQVRVKAVDALATRQGDERAVKAVLPLLEDVDYEVRIHAARALGAMGTTAARDALLDTAVKGEIAWIRDEAVTALAGFDAAEVAAKLLKRVRPLREDVWKARALEAYGRFAPPEELKSLRTWVRHKSVHVAAAAVRAVAHMARRAPKAWEPTIKLLEVPLKQRKTRKHFFAYAAAIDALGAMDAPRARLRLVEELLLQPDEDPYVPARIARHLGRKDPDRVRSAVNDALQLAETPAQRARLARLAAAARIEPLAPLLQTFLRGAKDERLAAECVRTLGVLEATDAKAELEKALVHKSPRVRIEAVTALARILDGETFRGLQETIFNDPWWSVRRQFVCELEQLDDPAAIPVLTGFAADDDWRVASAAIATIGTLGVAQDLPLLETHVEKKDWRIRATVFEAMGRLRAAKAIPRLTAGLADKDPVVVGVCLANLQILSREKFDADPKKWRAWWTKHGEDLKLKKRSRMSAEEKEKEEADRKKTRYAHEKYEFERKRGVEILQKARIISVTGAWDHVERVLGHLDIPHTSLRAQELKKTGLNPNQVVLVNCEGNVDKDSQERLRWFVNVGGYLMTTDWALTKTVQPCFPGFMSQYTGSTTGNDVVVVEDAHPGHPFTRGIFTNVPALMWWLEIQAFPITVTYPERCDVIVDSSAMKQRYGSSPMATTFRWGLGKVQHSVSHFYLQEEGMQKASKPRDRMIFAADNLGLSLAQIRALREKGGFEGQLNEATMKEIAPDYSMFRLIVNVVKEKSDWVENL